MNTIKILYYSMLVLLLHTTITHSRMTYHQVEQQHPPVPHPQPQPIAKKPVQPNASQSVSTFAFALQNCFVGDAKKSCLHHAQAEYHPPLIIQKNVDGSDKVIQEVSELEVVSQNCAALSGSGGCNNTMKATASMGPITQKISSAGGHPNDINVTGLTPLILTPGKHRIKLPVNEDVSKPATNMSYFKLKPTTGPLKGQEIEIIFQNLTAYTKP